MSGSYTMTTKPDPLAPSKRGELKTTILISSIFLIMFTAYNAIQNIQSSLNQDGGLGVVSLSTLYGCIIISGVMTPAILHLTGAKVAMIITWVAHCLYTLANFYPTWVTLILFSVLMGLTAAPLWTSQSLYISQSALTYAKLSNEDSHVVLSRFNGIFFMMFELSQIGGNIISSVVLNRGSDDESTASNETYYCGANDCPMSGNVTSYIKEPDQTNVYILLSVFLFIDVVGLVITVVWLPKLTKLSDETNIVKTFISCVKLPVTDIKMLLLVPFIMFQAMEQAVLWAGFTKSYISCTVGIGMVGFIMASYGATTSVLAFLMSRAAKYTGRHPLFAIATLINMAVFVVLLKLTPDADHVYELFIIVILWGAAEAVWQTQSNTLIALIFEDQRDSAYANYHTWKAVGFTITFAYSSFLCVSTKLYIAISFLAGGMVLYWLVEIIHHFEQKKRHSPIDSGADYKGVITDE